MFAGQVYLTRYFTGVQAEIAAGNAVQPVTNGTTCPTALFSLIPAELLETILSYLDCRHQFRLCRVRRKWQAVLKSRPLPQQIVVHYPSRFNPDGSLADPDRHRSLTVPDHPYNTLTGHADSLFRVLSLHTALIKVVLIDGQHNLVTRLSPTLQDTDKQPHQLRQQQDESFETYVGAILTQLSAIEPRFNVTLWLVNVSLAKFQMLDQFCAKSQCRIYLRNSILYLHPNRYTPLLMCQMQPCEAFVTAFKDQGGCRAVLRGDFKGRHMLPARLPTIRQRTNSCGCRFTVQLQPPAILPVNYSPMKGNPTRCLQLAVYDKESNVLIAEKRWLGLTFRREPPVTAQ